MKLPSGSDLLAWGRLFTVCMVFLIDSATLVMANIALPSIQADLDFDAGSIQWVLTAYALTFGGFLLAFGRLCDVFGHKNILLFGMTLFNVTSIVCAVVPSSYGLIVGRAFQGLGAASAIPSAQSILSLTFDDQHRRNIAFAMWGMAGSTGFVLGPIIGGLFSSLVSWQWIFWFLLIIQGSLQVLAFFIIPKTPAKVKKEWSHLASETDLLGAFLSLAGLILIVYALEAGNIVGWEKAEVISTLVVGFVVIVVFLVWEVNFASRPLLPHYLWHDVVKISGCALACFTYAVWMGVNYLLTLELQYFGFSALDTALRFIPLGIVAFIVNIVVPPLLKPVGPRTLMGISWILALGGVGLLAVMDSTDDYWRYGLPGLILYTSGIATVYYLGNVLVVATAREEDQGTISGVYNMFLNVGGAVFGVALATTITESVSATYGGDYDAHVNGYRASYYYMLGLSFLGAIPSIFGMPNAKQLAEANLKQKDQDESSGRQSESESSGVAGSESEKTNGQSSPERQNSTDRQDPANVV